MQNEAKSNTVFSKMASRPLKIFSEEELKDRNRGLQEIDDVLKEFGIRFMLFDGVLLGAVRNKDFIPWDWDVELAVYAEEFSGVATRLMEAFDTRGFEIGSFVPDRDNLKLNVHKYGTKYSFIGFVEDGDLRCRSRWQYPKKFFNETTQIEFLGRRYSCPNPPEAYLEFQYGDWKTPKKETKQENYLERRIYRDVSSRVQLTETARRIVRKLRSAVRTRVEKIVKTPREPLFLKMIAGGVQDARTVIEIGSSDGAECLLMLNKGRQISQYVLFEPDAQNLQKVRARLGTQANRVSIFNQAISSVVGKREFFQCKDFPHLNSSSASPFAKERVEVDYTTLTAFLRQQQIEFPLFIKMDVEGHEVEILEDFLTIAEKASGKIQIAFELHPQFYSDAHSLEKILKQYFEAGFRVKWIESAALVVPQAFRAAGLSPSHTAGYRALYENPPLDFVLRYACHRHYELLQRPPYYTYKVARSLLIEKQA